MTKNFKNQSDNVYIFKRKKKFTLVLKKKNFLGERKLELKENTQRNLKLKYVL